MTKAEYFVYIFHAFSLIILKNGNCVPIDYCLQPLNKSDCHKPPTPVFSYYKPGSRCEIEVWRGCPTWNKFPDEYLCSHFCIGKFIGINYTFEEIVDVTPKLPTDPCKGELNTTQCTKSETKVYTYQNDTCIEASWWGCESDNRFEDEKSCKETCVKQEEDELGSWKKQLLLMQPDEVKDIDNLLDNIIEEGTTEKSETTSQPETTEAAVTEEAPTTIATTAEVTTEVLTTEEPTTTTTETTTTTTEPPGDADEVITT